MHEQVDRGRWPLEPIQWRPQNISMTATGYRVTATAMTWDVYAS